MKIQRFSLGELKTNTYLCFNENGDALIFDPGMDGEGMYNKIKEKGIIPKLIILTHGHFDHEMGAKAFADLSGAKICVHELDEELVGNPKLNCANFFYRGNLWGYPEDKADFTFKDGDIIGVGDIQFKVIHTPGHTFGSSCFDDGTSLFTGDTLFANGFGRADLYGGDIATIKKSLGKLLELEGDRKVYPGHGNSSSLLRERDNIIGYLGRK